MTLVWLIVLAAFSTLSCVDAHGYISQPPGAYLDIQKKTTFNTKINETINETVFGGKPWTQASDVNARTFAEAFNTSTYGTLRTMLDPVVSDCGNSRIDIPPIQVRHLTEVHYQNDEEHEGFVHTHHGPCEFWIDETRVFHSEDCAGQFHDYPAVIPIDYNVCPCGKHCLLRFYWLALHEPQWQVYKQCVPIQRGTKLPLGLCV